MNKLLWISIVFIGCKGPKQKTDFDNHTPSNVAKYTIDESKSIMFDALVVQNQYSNKKTSVTTSEEVNSEIIELREAWSKVNDPVITSKIDSTHFPFGTLDTARIDLVKYQASSFPIYRNIFTQNMDKELWVTDCGADCIGEKKEILVLTGAAFLPNKFKKQTFDKMKDVLELLRFKEVQFKWLKSSSDFESIMVNSKSDDSPF